MIDESRTLEIYGYTSDSLSHGSAKLVIAVCEDCGHYRDIIFKGYRDLCPSCCQKGCYRSEETKKRNRDAARNRVCSDEARRKMSKARKGKPFSEEHKCRIKENHVGFSGCKHSDETKKKIGIKSRLHKNTDEWKRKMRDVHCGRKISDETRQKISKALSGKIRSEKTRKRLSAAHQGIPYDEWETYACDQRYCPKFNEVCRESNREKYGRKCFICGLPESENVTSTGKQRKLSVHHVDMDKTQGCDGVNWKLVPVCMSHHNHNELWAARFIYLLNSVWCD